MGSETTIIFLAHGVYYLCDECGTHIGKDEDYFLVEHFGENPVMYFSTTFNLTVDTRRANYRTEGEKVVTDVHCACGRLMGYKIVGLAPGVDRLILHTREVPVGTFVLHIFKLLKYNGLNFVRADEH